jgi:dienelactone hydrolase
MSTAFDVDPREPLGLYWRLQPVPPAFSGARCIRFEYSSRGDRVPGRLLMPEHASASRPAPLVLLQHGIGGSKDSPYMEACAPWVRGGAAVASIDFPLHGERSSAKLTQHFIEGLDAATDAEPSNPPHADPLWTEFARQSVVDVRRAFDALAGIEGVAGERVAFAGFSLGAMLGTLACALDPRPRGAALALAGGGIGPEALDPSAFIREIAPRPVLLVNATADARIPRAAAERLYEAAGEPREQLWFDSGHSDLPGAALKAMWTFLRAQLELGG